VERIDAGLDGRLVLVSAPAGFGKTTLLSEWLSTGRFRDGVAWLALDTGDNDPARFWSYAAAALHMAHPALADPAGSPADPDALLHRLRHVDAPLVLILDDYHAIESDAIHASLSFFLDHLPPSVHVVLSTRADPPLPLARLRARAQLAELRAADLRFTPAETAAFLGDVMGVHLSPEQLRALEARTEGWVAGLQLAALSLQTRPDAQGQAAFVVAFSGSHRFVLDYLIDEVLQQQPEPIQTFLLETSILERLSDSLCAAVTGDSASAAMLETLERRNVFLVPLDDERTWFRYHHLFGDALRHRLVQKSPERLPELHRRACAWFTQHGFELLAVEHALAARDWSAAARLIDRILDVLHARGESETVRRWLDEIPAEAQRQEPLLLVSAGRDWLHAGELDRAAVAVAEAGRLARDLHQTHVLARTLLLEASLADQRGDPARTVACAELAQGLLAEDDARGRASLTVLLARGALAQGDLVGAERALSLAETTTEDWRLRASRAVLLAMRGQLHDAVRMHEALLGEIGELPVAPAVEQRLQLATLHLEWNDLQLAERYFSEAFDNVARCHADVLIAPLHLAHARLLRVHNDVDACARALDQAEAAALRIGNLLQTRRAQALRAKLALLQGDIARAEQWAASVRGDASLLEPERIVEALVLARVDLTRGATVVLDPVLQRAVSAGHEWNAIAILVLHTLALESTGERDLASASLRSALQRATPGGFRRVFLDEGSALLPILRRLRATPLATELLELFDQGSEASPISAREREVLVLVAEGLSNREIAERLIVAPNTVKAHVRHLGTKLGASSRTQLLARAREAGLL